MSYPKRLTLFLGLVLLLGCEKSKTPSSSARLNRPQVSSSAVEQIPPKYFQSPTVLLTAQLRLQEVALPRFKNQNERAEIFRKSGISVQNYADSIKRYYSKIEDAVAFEESVSWQLKRLYPDSLKQRTKK